MLALQIKKENKRNIPLLDKLKVTRIANINRLMIDHINIKSLRNKVEMLLNNLYTFVT